jgi:hypothetical protein
MTLDWFHWIAEQRERRRGTGHWFEVPPHDVTETHRFVAQWPEVSRKLGLEPDPTVRRLFDPGRASYQSAVEGVSLGGPFYRDLLDAHTAADHGVYTDDVGVIASNAAAVASRSGAVRSRYLLADADQKRWPQPQPSPGYFVDRPVRVVDVVTVLSPRRNETILFVETLPLGGPSSSSAALPQSVCPPAEPPKRAPYVPEPVDPFVEKHPWIGGHVRPRDSKEGLVADPPRKLGAPHSPLQ